MKGSGVRVPASALAKVLQIHVGAGLSGRRFRSFGAADSVKQGRGGIQAAPRGMRGEMEWPSSLVALFGLSDLDCAEAFQWAVDEEDLHRYVGLDVGLA
jgi:hypothetical protein